MSQQDASIKVHAKQRRWARRFGLQALYQWEISQQPLDLIESHHAKNGHFSRADNNYFKDLLFGVIESLPEIEVLLKRYIDRPLTDIDPIELTILRIATYELLKRIDVPYRVILNEALELGKIFGATDGYKFVNGILDKIARESRSAEVLQYHEHK